MNDKKSTAKFYRDSASGYEPFFNRTQIRSFACNYRGRNKTRVETYYFFSNFFHLASLNLVDIKSHLGCHTCCENTHFKSV